MGVTTPHPPASLRVVNPLVTAHRRPHRRRPELTCTCDAAPYPHRAGSVPGCYGLDAYCAHGCRTAAHPEGAEFCPYCAQDEWYDYADTVWSARQEAHHL